MLSVLKISVDLLWAYWHSGDQEFLLSTRPRGCYTVYTMYGIHSDICFVSVYITTSEPHFLLLSSSGCDAYPYMESLQNGVVFIGVWGFF